MKKTAMDYIKEVFEESLGKVIMRKCANFHRFFCPHCRAVPFLFTGKSGNVFVKVSRAHC